MIGECELIELKKKNKNGQIDDEIKSTRENNRGA